jgi:hypothetical protein
MLTEEATMERTNPPRHLRTLLAATTMGALLFGSDVTSHAGCGCDKPAPRPAAVRPDVTYAGTRVSFFSSAFGVGESYLVTFTSMDGTSATTTGTVAAARDLADAVEKPQLQVLLPSLPLGPASIAVRAAEDSEPILTISDRDFTVAPQPIAMPLQYGSWSYPETRLAVDRDGVAYLSLDLTTMTQPLVFEAEMDGYPLRFTARDLVFMNIQGFLMQLLVQPQSGEAIPGMFVYPSSSPNTTSDRMHYSRHEFRTYFLDHVERMDHAVDATGSWHADGTRHVDHDHLVVAIIGRLQDGTTPAPGSTPAFTLRMKAYSLFHNGLTGDSSIALGPLATTTSFDSRTGLPGVAGLKGDVFTNGKLQMSLGAIVGGNAAAASFQVGLGAVITGTRTTVKTPETFMAATAPKGLQDLGDVSLTSLLGRRTIVGPGSFKANRITVSNSSQLFIDNSAGPVTIYVADSVKVSTLGAIVVADPDPEKFALYVTGTGGASFQVAGSFYGVVYAPSSTITLAGGGLFTGAFLGKSVAVNDASVIRYDAALLGH